MPHTPGPWGWFGNSKGNLLYLATVRHGRRFVMQFSRWGFRGSQPVFQRDGVMRPAADFLKFEVGDPDVTGVEQATPDRGVYRHDILGIDHPDARLILAAPAYALAWSLVPDEIKGRIFDALYKPDTEWVENAIAGVEADQCRGESPETGRHAIPERGPDRSVVPAGASL